MASYEISLIDQIGRTNRIRSEAQMRHRHGAGLFRVIHEVALGVVGRSLPDDFDGVLVCPDGSI